MSSDARSRSRSEGYAIDVAILPPPDVSQRAVALSASLPPAESQGLHLGPEFLPHITLLQQFISRDRLDEALARVDGVLRNQPPLALRVTGGARGSNSVWMAIERSPAIVSLHERVLDATAPVDAADGEVTAFFAAEARGRDVRWVREFRRESSLARFTPHITVGHASEAPLVEPFEFVAATIAVCHLGRFCSCRKIIRAWELDGSC